MEDYIIINCPNCNDYVLIYKNDIKCGIFRHAVYKYNMTPIEPHSDFETCQKLLKENKIFGCCKPFKITIDNNNYTVSSCDYI